MGITHLTVKAPGQTLAAVADWNAAHAGTAPPEAHSITGAAHTSAATPGKILQADANGLPINATNTDTQVSGAVSASHAKQHALDATADHTIGSLTNTYLVKNDGSKLVNATNTDSQVSGAVSASHARQHAITSTSEHTSSATSGKMLKADANGLPIDASNTDTQVAAAVSASHAQNTDTALGANCEAADHGTAATDMVVNVCYGTSTPPTASTTTEGTIFLKYTA